MAYNSKHSTLALLWRSFEPSGISAFTCLTVALLLVIANVVLQSIDVGTSLPGLLDGQWSLAYTQHVVQPLTELLNSNTLNKILVAVLWGIAGFVIYIGFECAVHWFRNLRESREDIRIGRNNVIERPLQAEFWFSLVWRIGVIIGGAAFLLVVQPLLSNALGVAHEVLLNPDLLHDGLRVLLAIAEWAFVMHGFIVFLRLYTRRTRLFGDDDLY